MARPARPSSESPEVSATSALVPAPSASMTATGWDSYSLSRQNTSASATSLPIAARRSGPKPQMETRSLTPS